MSILVPESRRWLDAPLPAGARVTVAGVAGGVGTTTLTGLLWWTLTTYASRSVGLLDHGGGALHARLPAASPTRTPDLVVHDAGPVALSGAPTLAAAAPLVVVCAATAAGIDAATTAVRELTPRPEEAWRRCVVVPVATTGAGLPGTALREHAHRQGLPAAVVPLRRSRPLAAGGDIPDPARSRATADAYRSAVAVAAEAMRCLTSTMGSTPHARSR